MAYYEEKGVKKMTKGVIYKCPYEGNNCKCGKHCFILKTTKKLETPISVLHKCPAIKEDIQITIGENGQ